MAQRTTAQLRELERANRELIGLRAYGAAASTGVVLAPSAVLGAGVYAYQRYGQDQGDFRQLFYNQSNNRPILGQRTDGTWVRFTDEAPSS